MYSLTQPHAVKAETHAVDAAVAALPVRIDLRSDTVTKPTAAVSTARCFGLRGAAALPGQSWQLQPWGRAALRGAHLAAQRRAAPAAAQLLHICAARALLCFWRALRSRRGVAQMRAAMAAAEVGDDVMGDDPTVQRLERDTAQLLGKAAGLFVPSGTMSNLLAVCTWCSERGSEFVVGSAAHIHIYEQGGTASLGGVHPRVVPNAEDGTMSLADIEACVRPDDVHFAQLRLVCLETTHNKCGGVPLPLDYIDAVGALTKRHGLALHIDGARICNAAVALGEPVARVAAAADSVSVCLSKGLGAPVGSVLVGPADFILKARRLRKALGGGMRQAGVIAAAALVALEEILPRLGEDHANMTRLAAGLNSVPGVSLRGGEVPRTNIAFLELAPSIEFAELQAELRKRGIAVSGAPGLMRVVTHHQVSAEDVDEVVTAFRAICTPMFFD